MSESNTYITADLHLGHHNIIKYCDRPFTSVQQMNEELIARWNDTVRENDRVFFLGDFALTSREEVISFGRRLHGRKVMIYGNHDHHRPSVYYEAGFEHVSKWPIVIQNRFLLSHAPMFAGSGSGVDPGTLINIHGHIHNKIDQGATISAKSACVCVERWDYKPVELRVLERLIKDEKQNHNDNHNLIKSI